MIALSGIAVALRRRTVPTSIVHGMVDTFLAASSGLSSPRPRQLARVRALPGSKLFWPEKRRGVVAEEARALWNARQLAAAACLDQRSWLSLLPRRL